MRIDVVTIFPEAIEPFLKASLLGKAAATGKLEVQVHNLRDFTTDKHRQTDDEPYGGGVGMVMKPEAFFAAVESIPKGHVVLLSATGRSFTQDRAKDFAGLQQLTLLCGRYEGVDERVAEHLADEELSIGDYVLAGGEAAALVVIDTVARLVPGVVGSPESISQESFEGGNLDFPQYTRPASFRSYDVPEVLLGGNHAEIARWRASKAADRLKRRGS